MRKIDLPGAVEGRRNLALLKSRYEICKSFRDSHLLGVDASDDSRIREIHRAIAASLQDVLRGYEGLFDALQRHDAKRRSENQAKK